MKSSDKTLGFCSLCMQNVEHTRLFSTAITRYLDLLTLGVLGALRIGPYYCFQCESKFYYLKPVRRDVPTFDSLTMASRFSKKGGITLVAATDNSEGWAQVTDTEDETIPEILPAEPLGNLFKSEQSLVMQERRTNSFSVRFRDSIVMRILQGETSLTIAKQELNLKEVDLIRWIADLMDRKQRELDQIRQILQSAESELPETIRINLRSTQGGGSEELDGIVLNRESEDR